MMFIKHPTTGKPDLMVTLSTVTTMAAVIKFILDGVTISWQGYTMDFGHLDSMTYAALLTPVLGAHSYMDLNKRKSHSNNMQNKGVDNPDEDKT